MKSFFKKIVVSLCITSSLIYADGPLPSSPEIEAVDDTDTSVSEEEVAPVRKHVSKASPDAQQGRSSTLGKYLLAGSSAALGIIAIILVSRHGGRRSHH